MKQTFHLLTVLFILMTLTGCDIPSGETAVVTITPYAESSESAELASDAVLPAHATAVPSATPDARAPLWVAVPPDGAILRVDPVSNMVSFKINVDGRPDITAWGEEGIWALDRTGNKLLRIDPMSNEVSAVTALEGGQAEALTIGGGWVWVGMTGIVDLSNQVSANPVAEGKVEVATPGWVYKIDPSTSQIVEKISVQPVSQMQLNGSYLWVLSHSAIDTPLQVLDIANQQGMAVPLRNAPEWMISDAFAVDSGSLWLFSSAYGKIFHASADGRIDSTVPLDVRQPTGYADLLVAYGKVWAATPWGSLLTIDPFTNSVEANIDLTVPLTALYAEAGSIWALSQQAGILFRLDPFTGTLTAQISIGSPLAPTVVPSPTPRVVIWQPCPDAPASRLKVGDIAYVTKDPPVPNRVRKEPNRETEILGLINPGAGMDIIGGPTCADGWVWWQVRNADMTGWTAEGDQETYWLIPLFK